MAAKFSIPEIKELLGGVLLSESEPGMTPMTISTDTRTLNKGEAFFALIGEKYDAHDYLGKAAAAGAALLVISNVAKMPKNCPCAALVVDDTLRAYQDLAAYYRGRVDPFVIAITGSVGKTTLKDMVACVLSQKTRAAWTDGNLNNQVGLPRTILEMDEDTETLVLEMGMSRAGEIKRLAEIARPDACAITNIGMAHRENFDTDDGILKAKFEITSFLGADGALVTSWGSRGLSRLAKEGSLDKGYKVLQVAAWKKNSPAYLDYLVTRTYIDETDISISRFKVKEQKTREVVPFAIPLPGTFAGVSAAMAAALCSCAGVSLAETADALAGLKRTPHRLETVRAGGILVIDDTYNASPDSARAGLTYLKNVPSARRIAVLADMFELGANTWKLHEPIGKHAYNSGVNILCAYGKIAKAIANGAEKAASGTDMQVVHFGADRKAEMIDWLRRLVKDGDTVYVKGSRSMKMEDVVNALTGGEA